MDRSQVGEIQYISHVDNVESILTLGILSDRRSAAIKHVSVASTLIKARRAPKQISAARTLPDYANLYLCARNKMMSGLLYGSNPVPIETLCVLQINETALDVPDAVIADGNASSEYTRFDPVPVGLPRLDFDRIHAEWWTRYEDVREKWEHGRVKNAELLIPDVLPPDYVTGALAPNEAVAAMLRPIMAPRPVVVAPYVFFAGPRT